MAVIGTRTTAAAALIVWFTAEILQNVMNKILMSNPKHFLGSLALASINTLAAAILDFVAIKFYFFRGKSVFTGPSRLVNRTRASELFVVSISMFLGKNLTMAAYEYIPLSLSNVIKMTQPVFVVTLGYLWLDRLPTGRVLLTLPVILLGALLVVGTDVSFNFIGFFAIFLANCLGAMRELGLFSFYFIFHFFCCLLLSRCLRFHFCSKDLTRFSLLYYSLHWNAQKICTLKIALT